MGGGTLMRKSPFDTWAEWRRKQAAGETLGSWASCARCWGQRIEIEGLTVYSCPACLGIGEVPTS